MINKNDVAKGKQVAHMSGGCTGEIISVEEKLGNTIVTVLTDDGKDFPWTLPYFCTVFNLI